MRHGINYYLPLFLAKDIAFLSLASFCQIWAPISLNWGGGQTKIDVPTGILLQWHASLPQTSHSDGRGTYQASVAERSVMD